MLIQDLPTKGLITVDGLSARLFAKELGTVYERAKRPVVLLEPSGAVLPSVMSGAHDWDTVTIVPLPRTWSHNQSIMFEFKGVLNIRACNDTLGIVVGEEGWPHLGEKVNLAELNQEADHARR